MGDYLYKLVFVHLHETKSHEARTVLRFDCYYILESSTMLNMFTVPLGFRRKAEFSRYYIISFYTFVILYLVQFKKFF